MNLHDKIMNIVCDGSTLDYVVQTADCLRMRGVTDREIERLVALALDGAARHTVTEDARGSPTSHAATCSTSRRGAACL